MKNICIVFFIFYNIFDISAQYIIIGEVKDLESKVINRATLILTDTLKADFMYITQTDSVGNFIFTSVPKSNYILHVSAIGYESQDHTVDLGNTNHFSIVLEKMISYDLETVNVKAKLPQVRRRNGKFTMDHIYLSPFAQGVSTYSFLKFVPLINISADGVISILNRSESVVYINGRKSNMPSEAIAAMLKGIPASDIERVEIIPTPGSSYSSSENSGIVNVVIRKRPNEGARVTVVFGDEQSYYNSQNASAFFSYSKTKLDLTCGINGLHTRFRNEALNLYDFYETYQARNIQELTVGSSYRFGSYFNMEYTISKQHILGFRFNLSGNDLQNNQSNITQYSRIGNAEIDSIYFSSYQKRFPTLNYGLGMNLNYDFKMDDLGSIFKVDFTYQRRISDHGTKVLSEQKAVLVEDYMMHSRNKLDVYKLKTDYRCCIDSDNKLELGMSFSGGRSANDYFFGNNSEEGYVSDPLRTNDFVLDDITGAGYISYERSWSERIQTVVGLRFETYNAKGTQLITSERIKRKDNHLLPSFSLDFAPSEHHAFSVETAFSTTVPRYSLLNPFKEYLSPTTYKENNPYLESMKNLNVVFSYTMFDDYMFLVDYTRNKNVWSEFALPVGNNLIRQITLNSGIRHGVDVDFSISKYLFDNYFHVVTNLTASYLREKGEVETLEINIKNVSYAFSIKADVILSKLYKVSLFAQYKWNSVETWAAGTIDQHQSFEFSLVKRFKNSSLTLAGYNFLYRGPQIQMNTPEYSYSTRLVNKKPCMEFTYTYTFGNQKVKKVDSRNDIEINKRVN